MFTFFKKPKQIVINLSKKSEPFYNDADALEFIFKETGVDRRTIRKIMNADLRYQKSVGIIDWEDLDDFIAYWTEEAEKLEQ